MYLKAVRISDGDGDVTMVKFDGQSMGGDVFFERGRDWSGECESLLSVCYSTSCKG